MASRTRQRLFIALIVFVVFMGVFMQAETPDQQSVIFAFAIGLGIYLIPYWVAVQREHHNAAAIGVLNLLLGWTLIGWVGALVWACTATRDRDAAAAPGAASSRP